jgi:hypothetical protein
MKTMSQANPRHESPANIGSATCFIVLHSACFIKEVRAAPNSSNTQNNAAAGRSNNPPSNQNKLAFFCTNFILDECL